MVRSTCCEENIVKRGVWTAEEDAKISAFVSKHGSGNWTSIPKKTGLKRCGKSCRLRWTNCLRPDLKQDNFTPQEEDLIIKLHAAIGSRWSIIAQQLPGRTDNDVKIYWNTKVKKKLSQMGIDPVTHKPFSKLIADYGNINGCQKPSTQNGPENKDFNNAINLKSEPYYYYQTLPQGLRNTSNDQLNQLLPTSPSNTETKIIAKGDLKNENILEDACSTSSAQGGALLVPFSWNDFLLEDAFAPSDESDNQEQENGKKKEIMSQQAMCSDFEFSSSSDISFVETMLGQENEMFLSFPHLLEEPSNY